MKLEYFSQIDLTLILSANVKNTSYFFIPFNQLASFKLACNAYIRLQVD